MDDKKPNKMDTPDFGEITKQKIGYRLREVLNGKKIKVRGQEGPARNYEFDPEKLKRIAKKYGCSLVPKFPTGTSSHQSSTPQSPEKPQEIHEKPADLTSKDIGEPVDTPPKVVQLGNSGTIPFEELVLRTKSVYRLTMACYGIEACRCCGVEGKPDWQYNEFDDSWGFLCGLCGLKLSEKLDNHS